MRLELSLISAKRHIKKKYKATDLALYEIAEGLIKVEEK